MTTATETRQPLESYVKQQAAISELLQSLTNRVNEMQDEQTPESIDWGHVGDLWHVRAKLTDIMETITPSDRE